MKKMYLLPLTVFSLLTATFGVEAQASGLDGRWSYTSGPRSCPSSLTIEIAANKRSATVHTGQELLSFSVESGLRPGVGFISLKTTIRKSRIAQTFKIGSGTSVHKKTFQKSGSSVTFIDESSDAFNGKSKIVCKYN